MIDLSIVSWVCNPTYTLGLSLSVADLWTIFPPTQMMVVGQTGHGNLPCTRRGFFYNLLRFFAPRSQDNSVAPAPVALLGLAFLGGFSCFLTGAWTRKYWNDRPEKERVKAMFSDWVRSLDIPVPYDYGWCNTNSVDIMDGRMMCNVPRSSWSVFLSISVFFCVDSQTRAWYIMEWWTPISCRISDSWDQQSSLPSNIDTDECSIVCIWLQYYNWFWIIENLWNFILFIFVHIFI